MIEAAEAAAEQPAVVGGRRRRPRAADHRRRRPAAAAPGAATTTRPGQSVSLETDLRPKLWRYYSPANAPRPDGLMELHVKARDGGPVSTALVRRVGVGDVLRLGPPVGHLVLHDDSDRDLLLVAGGLGLAPAEGPRRPGRPKGPPRRVDLFAGFRTEDQIYDRADLQRLEREHPWLTVTFAVSEDKISDLEHGDIGDVVLRHGPWNSREVCVAGPAVDGGGHGVPARCSSGVPTQRISSEVFAPSRPGPSVDGEVTE